MNQPPPAFRSLSATEAQQQLQTAKEGLTGDEARQRLARHGSNLLKPPKRSDVFTLLLAQFESPLILILFFATGLSFFLHDPANASNYPYHCPGKRPSGVLAGALGQRTNTLWMGTHIGSGNAKALVRNTGKKTQCRRRSHESESYKFPK